MRDAVIVAAARTALGKRHRVCQASIPSICRRSCFERWRSASALIRNW